MATYALQTSGSGLFNPVTVPGSFFEVLVNVFSGTADYTTGGYAFGLPQLQTITGGAYSVIESVDVVNNWGLTAGGTTTNMFIALYDNVNKKVQAFGMAAAAGVSTGLTEIAASSANLNSRYCTLRVRFF